MAFAHYCHYAKGGAPQCWTDTWGGSKRLVETVCKPGDFRKNAKSSCLSGLAPFVEHINQNRNISFLNFSHLTFFPFN